MQQILFVVCRCHGTEIDNLDGDTQALRAIANSILAQIAKQLDCGCLTICLSACFGQR